MIPTKSAYVRCDQSALVNGVDVGAPALRVCGGYAFAVGSPLGLVGRWSPEYSKANPMGRYNRIVSAVVSIKETWNRSFWLSRSHLFRRPTIVLSPMVDIEWEKREIPDRKEKTKRETNTEKTLSQLANAFTFVFGQ